MPCMQGAVARTKKTCSRMSQDAQPVAAQDLAPPAPAAAAVAGGTSTAAGSASQPAMDFASILSKIQMLEKEKADMRAQLESANVKLSKLQESKRVEMEQMMNSTISKWLENLQTKDESAKQQLKDGLSRLVQQGDESGVWNVIACASSNWVHNVSQIESLTNQLNEYKEKERLLSGGIFQSEESRVSSSMAAGEKRKYEDMSGMAHGCTSSSDCDIWSEFQSMMMSSGGNRGLMDMPYRGAAAVPNGAASE